MSRFPSSFLDELIAKNDIVAVVSEYIQLSRKAGRFWACCPFHGEKTPSFSVNPDKQMYYCFGCHAGGSVINFVMEMDKLSYVDAIKQLASRVGMELPEEVDDEKLRQDRAKRERLWAACKEAAIIFNQQLYSPIGNAGLSYFTKRGLNAGVIKRFGLGYSAQSWDMLIKQLSGKGFSEDELVEAGLAQRGKSGGIYDAFRDRVMFPIIGVNSKVIGFGARTMGSDEPKYLNTGETLIFNKRMNLYGLNMQKGKRIDDLLLVEGYMDVISLNAGGVTNAVASLGTAFTAQQARLIKRFCQKVYVCYDGDSAGQNASLRSLDILSQAGLNVRIITIPDGLDPDEFIRQRGDEEFSALKSAAQPINAYKLDKIATRFDLMTEDGREEYVKQACAFIRTLEPVEKERYASVVSKTSGISKDTVRAQCMLLAPSDTEHYAGNIQGNLRDNRSASRKERESPIVKEELMLASCMLLSRDTAKRVEDAMNRAELTFTSDALGEFIAAMNEEYLLSPTLPPSWLTKHEFDQETAAAAAQAMSIKVLEPERTVSDCIKTMTIRKAQSELIYIQTEYSKDTSNSELAKEYFAATERLAKLKRGV